MRPRHFQATSMYSDWNWSYVLNDFETFDDDDRITLTVTPEFIGWDDYGFHSRTFPATEPTTPWAQYYNGDGTDYVVCTDPNLISLYLPASVLRPMGPGMVDLGLSYSRLDTGTRTPLWHGRLPLMTAGGA